MAKLARQALQQIDMFGRAGFDDQGVHLAVIQHMNNRVLVVLQWRRAEFDVGVNLNCLWGCFFMCQDAQIGVEAQPVDAENAVVVVKHQLVPSLKNLVGMA